LAERAFLDAIAASLGTAGLVPAPALMGPAEPNVPGDLPAVVLSLGETARVGSGLGAVTRVRDDQALQVVNVTDLASPFLADDPTFSLWNAAQRTLTLHHGGLVRNDLSPGPLRSVDIRIRINGGAPRTLVAGPPGPAQYSVNPVEGQVVFGFTPPAGADIEATYYLGLWTQQIVRIKGTLTIDVVATAVNQVNQLSTAIIDHLLAPARRAEIVRLLAINVVRVGSVARPEQGTGGRRRTLAFTFDYEQEINEAPSSGGVIRRVQIDSNTVDVSVDPNGAIVEELVLERSG
jgi:hypothetical protein